MVSIVDLWALHKYTHIRTHLTFPRKRTFKKIIAFNYSNFFKSYLNIIKATKTIVQADEEQI